MKRMNMKQNLLNPLNLLTISCFFRGVKGTNDKIDKGEPGEHLCCPLCTCVPAYLFPPIVHRKGQLGN